MATLKQAYQARQEHDDALAEAGAHAVGVEPGEAYGHKGFVIIAYVEPGKGAHLPKSVHTGKEKTEVPVVVEKAERFHPEDLDT